MPIPPTRTSLRFWLFVLLCALGFAAAAPGSAARAQAVVARGATHGDFARLVLDFTQPVATQVVAEGRRMELQFDRPAKLDLGGALSNLRSYIRSAKLARDGRTLDIDFTGPVTWRVFNDGMKLAVDFALADGTGQQQFDNGPGAASNELATGPEGAVAPLQPAKSAVQLRAGEHDGFSRLAFDWPKDVGYELAQSGDQAELRFASPAAIDVGRVAADLPPRLKAISLAPITNGVAVRLQLKPGMLLRDFRSGRTVVLDIYDQTAANIPPPAPSEAAAALQPVQPAIPESGSVASSPNAPETASPAGPPVQEIDAGQEPVPLGAGIAPELQSAMPEAPLKPPVATAGPTGGATGPGVAAPVAAAPPATFEPPRVAPPAVGVKVTALPSKDGATLYFDWPKPVALAVFRRGDALWLVFDAPGRTNLKALQRVAAVIGRAEPVKSTFALAIRLVGGAAASPTTSTEGTRWKIMLQPGTAVTPVESLQQKRETLANGGTSLLVQAIASGAAVELADPTDHGLLAVTPEQLAGLGVARESDWPDFKLLPSYQGVAVEKLSNRVEIQSGPNGVVITTPAAQLPAPQADAQAGLPQPNQAEAGPAPPNSTPPNPIPADQSQAAMTMPPAPNAMPAVPSVAKPLSVASGLFDLPKWRRGGEASFLTDLQDLKDRLDQAPAADRNRARLDLAEFYLANGFGVEAGGLIDTIRGDDHDADGNPLIMAIAATAKTMAGEYDAADRLLALPALQGVPEANLMRAVIAAKRGDSVAAAKLFGGPLPDLSPYPKSFRTQARLLAARAMLDVGDPLTAQNYLDPIKSDAPDPDAEARANFLDGMRQLKLGQKDAALQTWGALAESPIDEIKARSRFAVVSEKLAEKQIEPKDAVTQLEALRFLWRGDTFEFDLLNKLGHLYCDTGQPRRGLLTLRQAATHFPEHPQAKQAAQDMTTEFRKLYLQGGADQLSPLRAVALYDEFRELTPTGADGDRMIAALADRLVKVDLLDRAGDVLERQVKTRLSGVDKVAAGTRLAAIRLLDDKPDQALMALTESEDPAASPELQAERRRLQARALFDNGDTLKGLGLVRDDGSLEGLWLKSDMFWKLREWPSAADALGQLIEAEQVKRGQAGTAVADAAQVSAAEIAKNPASVLDQAMAQANAAAAVDAAGSAGAAPAPAAGSTPPAPVGAAAPTAGAAATPAGPQFDPVLARLVLNRAVALSLAGDRRGLKDIGRNFARQMATSALADPFKVLTSPDTGLAESITAQMKSVDQLGVFVDEYKKILTAQSLSGVTEPSPDLGPSAPMDAPANAPAKSSGGAAAPADSSQTAGQPPAKATGQ